MTGRRIAVVGGGRILSLLHRAFRPPLVAAVWSARARLKTAARYPWSTAAVSVRIRWQGVRLCLRGLPVIPRPAHQSQEGVQ